MWYPFLQRRTKKVLDGGVFELFVFYGAVRVHVATELKDRMGHVVDLRFSKAENMALQCCSHVVLRSVNIAFEDGFERLGTI